ncbi:hypothetical protein AA16663_1572 [Komagataeibacter rhaeticus DSM 16663]|nr:hypothetical protein AA16663_1572 [Komagataeibacter rhaeticus DSM 16663]
MAGKAGLDKDGTQRVGGTAGWAHGMGLRKVMGRHSVQSPSISSPAWAGKHMICYNGDMRGTAGDG